MESTTTRQIQGARRCERKPYERIVDYSVSVPELQCDKTVNLKGRTVDISETGIGIETDYPLAPGHTLWFREGTEHESGVVKWCMKLVDNYRVGIALTGKSPSTELSRETDENPLFVSEETERYQETLDRVTTQFNEELSVLEKRTIDPQEDPAEITRAVTDAFETVINACAEFEKGVAYDKDVIKNARIRFREKTNPTLSKSYYINRTRTWPQGQQGDYKTLEYLYKNTPLSEGIGYYLDLSYLNAPIARAVRNRIKKLAEILSDEISMRQEPSILNVACGSCRELMWAAPEVRESGARVICVDNDDDALTFAQGRLSYVGIEEQVSFYKYNALRLFDYDSTLAIFGKQDIIYSLGLFDYLPSDFLVKMFRTLYALLNEGGRFIPTFKDAARYRSQEYHWIVDWDGFMQRTQADFEEILSLAGIPSSAISEVRDETGLIIFYLITK